MRWTAATGCGRSWVGAACRWSGGRSSGRLGTGRQDGATVSLYGEALPAGGSVTTGFDGVHNGVNPLPTTYLLNGDACQPALVATAGESGASTSNSGKGKGGGSGGDDDD